MRFYKDKIGEKVKQVKVDKNDREHWEIVLRCNITKHRSTNNCQYKVLNC